MITCNRTQDTGRSGRSFGGQEVLKELPARQLLPTMFFMRASLGVSCDHCHVDFEHFESDANRVKQTAREMMRMVEALNRERFEGERRVNCNTCHRGQPRPSAPLPFASITTSPAARARAGKPAPNTPLPTVDQEAPRHDQPVEAGLQRPGTPRDLRNDASASDLLFQPLPAGAGLDRG